MAGAICRAPQIGSTPHRPLRMSMCALLLQFYRWAVSGWIHPWDTDPNEARKLLDLRYRLSALAAAEYCDAGFTTVVQDNIFGEDIRTRPQSVQVRPRHLVVLRPSVAVVIERDQARQREPGKIASAPGRRMLTNSIGCSQLPLRIGLWLDTSTQTPIKTVQTILKRQPEAAVDSII